MKKKKGKEEAATWVGVEELRRWEENPRNNKAAISHVAESIERFGFASPIIARAEDKTIIAGHTRYEAALQLGLESVPVRFMNLSLADSKLLALADNKTAEIATWDEEELEKVLQSLVDEGHNVEGLGWNEEELQELIDLSEPSEAEDEPPEVREDEEPSSQLGEVYQLGEHRLICGDSTDPATWEKLMQGKRADMIFTDPPYGVSYTGGLKNGKKGLESNNRKMIKNDDVDLYYQAVKMANQYVDGVVFMFYADTVPFGLYRGIEDVDGEIVALIIWKKKGGYGALGASYKPNHEPCLIWKPKGKKTNFIGSSNENRIWEISKEGKNKLHPTQKPIAIPLRAIKNHKAEIIVDMFSGSGSTLIASQIAKRKFYGIELDPRYCDVIRRRWAQYAADNNLDKGDGLDG